MISLKKKIEAMLLEPEKQIDYMSDSLKQILNM